MKIAPIRREGDIRKIKNSPLTRNNRKNQDRAYTARGRYEKIQEFTSNKKKKKELRLRQYGARKELETCRVRLRRGAGKEMKIAPIRREK